MWSKNSLWMLKLIVLLALASIAQAQTAYIICATNTQIANDCEELQRGNSAITCQYVQDSVECAKRIQNKTADFGVFSAESMLLLASLNWEDLTVVRELRSRERRQKEVDYESVVVARTSQINTNNLTSSLRGAKYCHPGLHYERSQKWSERFLKHFEREVTTPLCSQLSAAEIEVATISNFFGSSCRPGIWSSDKDEDARLKMKYPSLCSLCGGNNCNYENTEIIDRHSEALKCLIRGGDIAYVSAEDAVNFFLTGESSDFQYMCPNGTLTATPCSWLRQPWRAIVANTNHVPAIANTIDYWMNSQGQVWTDAIRNMLQSDNQIVIQATPIQTVREYVRFKRPIPLHSTSDQCSTLSTWCTTSRKEQEKCEILSYAGLTTGVLPLVECKNNGDNDVACLREIQAKRSDFTGIDSNHGYIARNVYNLQSTLYAETENAKYSHVVVVIKDSSSITRFENLRGVRACFPEYGGITSLAFINIGKSRGFLKSDECVYEKLISEFFAQSCAPGANDPLHQTTGSSLPENLCSLCKATASGRSAPVPDDETENAELNEEDATESPIDSGDVVLEGETEIPEVHIAARALLPSCDAGATNRYFGSRGALQCLFESGDVAIVELQNLEAHAQAIGVASSNFRVLCRNGTLAAYNGFKVDAACALTTIVDGEIIVRRNDPKSQGIRNALLSLDRYLINDPTFRMYNIFSSERDLLFQDSTLGLSTGQELNLSPSVESYKKLFQDTESCVQSTTGSGNTIVINFYIFVVTLIVLTLRI